MTILAAQYRATSPCILNPALSGIIVTGFSASIYRTLHKHGSARQQKSIKSRTLTLVWMLSRYCPAIRQRRNELECHMIANQYAASSAIFTDAWTFSKAAIGWNQAYEQASRERFYGRVSQVFFGPLQIMYERTDHPYSYCGHPRKGSRVFSVRLPSPGRTMCGGREFSSQGVNTCRWDAFDRVVANGRVESVIVVADEQFLRNESVRVFNEDHLRKSMFYDGSIAPQSLARSFCVEILSVLSTSLIQPNLLAHDGSRRILQSRTLNALLAVIEATTHPPQRPPSPSTRGYIVNRAIQYIDEHIAQPISTHDICAALRTSARTLRYSFEFALGVSPIQYLLARRLNAVHRELAHGIDESNIDEIASRWGFTHMGRFAEHYRNTFGERPSATARARRQVPKSLHLSDQ